MVDYDPWSVREQTALRELGATIDRLMVKIAKLPEFKAYCKRSASQGGAPVMWLESPPPRNCTAANPSCAFVFYAGEIIDGHATRWATFRIARHGEGISVQGIEMAEPAPYAQWRRGKH